MQKESDFVHELQAIYTEFVDQIKLIPLQVNSNLKDQNLQQITNKFDALTKKFTQVINMDQCVQNDNAENIVNKINKKKNNILQHYTNKINKLKSTCSQMIQQIDQNEVKFCEDFQNIKHRYKTQINQRQKAYNESIEKIKERIQNQQKVDIGNSQSQFDEMNKQRIHYMQQEIKSLKQQIKMEKENQFHFFASSKETVSKSDSRYGIELFDKQKEYLQSNIITVQNRIANIRDHMTNMKLKYDEQLNFIKNEITNENQKQTIEEENEKLKEKINLMKNKNMKINKSKSNKIQKEIFEEILIRNEKICQNIKLNTEKYIKEINEKSNNLFEIINEIYKVKTQIEIKKENIRKENTKKLKLLKNEQRNEINKIFEEHQNIYNEYLNKTKTQTQKENIFLQNQLITTKMNYQIITNLNNSEVDNINPKFEIKHLKLIQKQILQNEINLISLFGKIKNDLFNSFNVIKEIIVKTFEEIKNENEIKINFCDFVQSISQNKIFDCKNEVNLMDLENENVFDEYIEVIFKKLEVFCNISLNETRNEIIQQFSNLLQKFIQKEFELRYEQCLDKMKQTYKNQIQNDTLFYEEIEQNIEMEEKDLNTINQLIDKINFINNKIKTKQKTNKQTKERLPPLNRNNK